MPSSGLRRKTTRSLTASASSFLIDRSGSVNMTVIGLISGTSYDAVDAAAARMRLEGHTLSLVPLGWHSVPIPAPLRARIAAALPPHGTTVDEICRLDTTIGQLFGSVAAEANAALTGGAEIALRVGCRKVLLAGPGKCCDVRPPR